MRISDMIPNSEMIIPALSELREMNKTQKDAMRGILASSAPYDPEFVLKIITINTAANTFFAYLEKILMAEETTMTDLKLDPAREGIKDVVMEWITTKIINTIKFKTDADAIKGAVEGIGNAIKAQFKGSDETVRNIINNSVDKVVSIINTVINDKVAAMSAGTLTFESRRTYTAKDATDFLARLGRGVPERCAAKLMAYPQIVEALEQLSPEDQYKAASDESILDRLIAILQKWGPIFLRIAMFVLPLFL